MNARLRLPLLPSIALLLCISCAPKSSPYRDGYEDSRKQNASGTHKVILVGMDGMATGLGYKECGRKYGVVTQWTGCIFMQTRRDSEVTRRRIAYTDGFNAATREWIAATYGDTAIADCQEMSSGIDPDFAKALDAAPSKR
jgi:hypothetical protein